MTPDHSLPESCQSGERLAASFARPAGRGGALAGLVMAFKNAPINELAVDALDVGPGDRILEIGFVHGDTIARLAGRAWAGFVAGVDTSEVMVRQARRRNRHAIREGRVDVRQADVSRLPFRSRRFDKVLSTDCFQLWPRPLEALREVRRVLRPGGRLLLVLRMRHPWRKRLVAPGFSADEIDAVRALAEPHRRSCDPLGLAAGRRPRPRSGVPP